MTRKDYIKIAQALNAATKYPIQYGLGIAIDNIADVLQADNAHFDRDRFLTAVREGR